MCARFNPASPLGLSRDAPHMLTSGLANHAALVNVRTVFLAGAKWVKVMIAGIGTLMNANPSAIDNTQSLESSGG